ncbi:hypothetical protein L083_0596 [Actinoplanes sp. N902-109]|nr:hypothetical protein L083_0596 [Actinoplanes sp. N902-109]
MIRSMLRGRGDEPGGVVQHTVGNALVLHAEDSISPEAQSLALAVVEDAENDVVVLDLGDGMPIGSWESMAGVLPRRRRGIRLVACGRQHNAAAMAGQWLSERLNRTVIAPDGVLVRGSAGALFVHSAPGSGWVRFRPGKPPAWDAKRYPTPLWDRAAIDNRASSSTGEIEPLPGGVWIHDTREPGIVEEHRKRLVADVPCQPETMTVLLGCPGTAPLSLDDVVRFWRELDPDARLRTRFVQYGDVRLPEGEAFGQALADLLGTHIICYTGVPVGAPHKFEIRTVRGDGVLGWPPFALELGYAPRAHPNSKARRPAVLSHRGPLRWTEEISPRVYWYAPDAVVEVVQAGLWVRGVEEPQNAERVRATPLDPEGSTLIFDDTVADQSARMRELAEDLAARVDPTVGQDTALFPASVLVPGQRPAGRAEAVLRVVESQQPAIQAPLEFRAVEAPPPAASIMAAPQVEAVVIEPVEPTVVQQRFDAATLRAYAEMQQPTPIEPARPAEPGAQAADGRVRAYATPPQAFHQPVAPPAPEFASPASQFASPTSQFAAPAPEFGPPAPEFAPPASQFAPPAPEFAPPASEFAAPAPEFGPPASEFASPASSFGPSSSGFAPSAAEFAAPAREFVAPPAPEFVAPPSADAFAPAPVEAIGGPVAPVNDGPAAPVAGPAAEPIAPPMAGPGEFADAGHGEPIETVAAEPVTSSGSATFEPIAAPPAMHDTVPPPVAPTMENNVSSPVGGSVPPVEGSVPPPVEGTVSPPVAPTLDDTVPPPVASPVDGMVPPPVAPIMENSVSSPVGGSVPPPVAPFGGGAVPEPVAPPMMAPVEVTIAVTEPASPAVPAMRTTRTEHAKRIEHGNHAEPAESATQPEPAAADAGADSAPQAGDGAAGTHRLHVLDPGAVPGTPAVVATERVLVQPVPPPAASALLPSRSLEEERNWLRRTLSRDFDVMASSVSRLMSEHPGLKAAGTLSAEDVLADSVAVRLYLSGRGAGIDAGLRSGSNGPHVPFARCTVSGLSRLPSFRGTTVYRTTPSATEWDEYRSRRVVTDWAFVNVLTGPCMSQEGDTDVLVWSMTARRTAVLEPEGDDRVTDRVLFLPGTHYKILELHEPADGERGAILLREIGANEISDDGRVDPNRVSLDELAVTSLRRSVERWAGTEPKRRVGPGSAGRFGVLPGLDRRTVREEVNGR